jgi:hypothetical protein
MDTPFLLPNSGRDPVCSQKSRTSPLLHCHRYAVSWMELNLQCRFDTLST